MPVVFQTVKLVMQCRRGMLRTLGKGVEVMGRRVQLVGAWVG